MSFFARPGQLIALLLVLFTTHLHASGPLRIAAASDLRYALDDIVDLYRAANPDAAIEVIYGSSGKMTTQIINGAPYDIFFSADISFPERLKAEGLTSTEPAVYALGRIVIWSNTVNAAGLTGRSGVGHGYPNRHRPTGARALRSARKRGHAIRRGVGCGTTQTGVW